MQVPDNCAQIKVSLSIFQLELCREYLVHLLSVSGQFRVTITNPHRAWFHFAPHDLNHVLTLNFRQGCVGSTEIRSDTGPIWSRCSFEIIIENNGRSFYPMKVQLFPSDYQISFLHFWFWPACFEETLKNSHTFEAFEWPQTIFPPLQKNLLFPPTSKKVTFKKPTSRSTNSPLSMKFLFFFAHFPCGLINVYKYYRKISKWNVLVLILLPQCPSGILHKYTSSYLSYVYGASLRGVESLTHSWQLDFGSSYQHPKCSHLGPSTYDPINLPESLQGCWKKEQGCCEKGFWHFFEGGGENAEKS